MWKTETKTWRTRRDLEGLEELEEELEEDTKKNLKRNVKVLKKMALLLLLPQPGPGSNILWKRILLRHRQGHMLPAHFKTVWAQLGGLGRAQLTGTELVRGSQSGRD